MKPLTVGAATLQGRYGVDYASIAAGVSGVLVAKALGARVVALDPIAERRAFATKLGADLALHPTDGDTAARIADFSGGGLSAAIDCSGNGAAQNMALDAAAPLGRVAFIGESRETTIRPSDQLIRKQLTLIGSWYFAIHEYAEITRLITEKKINVEMLATHRFSLDEAETAFRMFDERRTEKAVFVFG